MAIPYPPPERSFAAGLAERYSYLLGMGGVRNIWFARLSPRARRGTGALHSFTDAASTYKRTPHYQPCQRPRCLCSTTLVPSGTAVYPLPLRVCVLPTHAPCRNACRAGGTCLPKLPHAFLSAYLCLLPPPIRALLCTVLACGAGIHAFSLAVKAFSYISLPWSLALGTVCAVTDRPLRLYRSACLSHHALLAHTARCVPLRSRCAAVRTRCARFRVLYRTRLRTPYARFYRRCWRFLL